MPVRVAKRSGKYRLVESSGKVAKNRNGTAIDGGGHATHTGASSQARAVNANLKKKK